MRRPIADALWNTFTIEDRDAAYASQGTFHQWASEHPNIRPDDTDPGLIWNDAFRLGYLLGSGHVRLAEVGVDPPTKADRK